MNLTGKVKDLTMDIQSGKLILSLLTNENNIDLSGLDGLIDITIKKHREKRSNDANAYYWKLNTKLSECLKISKPRAHNMMLRKYGQYIFIDDKLVRIPIPDTEKAENDALESITFHIKPTSQVMVGKDGISYRTYTMLKGSSEYDTKEMSELIDGIVSECKELGIETMTPDELAQMMKAYKQ